MMTCVIPRPIISKNVERVIIYIISTLYTYIYIPTNISSFAVIYSIYLYNSWIFSVTILLL